MPSNYHCAEGCRFYPQNTVMPTSAALPISIVSTTARKQPVIICCSTLSFIWVISTQEWEKDIWLLSCKQSNSFEPETITLWNTLSFQKPHLFLSVECSWIKSSCPHYVIKTAPDHAVSMFVSVFDFCGSTVSPFTPIKGDHRLRVGCSAFLYIPLGSWVMRGISFRGVPNNGTLSNCHVSVNWMLKQGRLMLGKSPWKVISTRDCLLLKHS